MKREHLIVGFSIALTILNFGITHASEKYNFRKTRWGMTKERVLQAESAKLLKQENGDLFFSTKLLDKYSVKVIYIFIKDKLVEARYQKEVQKGKEKILFSAKRDFYSALKEIYGEPLKEDENQYTEEELMGETTDYYWETDDTEIHLYCIYLPQLKFCDVAICYVSKDLKHLIELEKEKKRKKAKNKYKGAL